VDGIERDPGLHNTAGSRCVLDLEDHADVNFFGHVLCNYYVQLHVRGTKYNHKLIHVANASILEVLVASHKVIGFLVNEGIDHAIRARGEALLGHERVQR
jgi:hypothetical protein